MSPKRFSCMGFGPKSFAGLTPSHFSTGCGAFHLRLPTGGAANGTPLNTFTPEQSMPSRIPFTVCTCGAVCAAAVMYVAASISNDRIVFLILIMVTNYYNLCFLPKQLLPQPQHDYRADDAEDKVLQVSGSEELHIKQRTDEGTDITAHNTNNQVHTASLALTAHNAVGNIADNNTCQYRPCRKFCNMFKHNQLLYYIKFITFHNKRILFWMFQTVYFQIHI